MHVLKVAPTSVLAFFLASFALVVVIAILASCNGDSGTTDIKEMSSRCTPAPQAIIRKLNDGLTASGDARLLNVQMVENNDGRPWRFFGAVIEAPGFSGETAVWATGSLDLDDTALIVAADTMAAEFSIWEKPGGGAGFASMFDDEIRAAQACAG